MSFKGQIQIKPLVGVVTNVIFSKHMYEDKQSNNNKVKANNSKIQAHYIQ